MKGKVLIFGVMIFILGCNHYNILPTIDDDKILIDKSGGIVRDCKGSMLLKKSPFTNKFWEKNNLPKGTTEFVCVNGKAYLPEKEPE